ncbi:MAG: tRNA 2-thiouridine(34) synthase MnmA [Lachnospiraceae bacterium]|nr:tRNA 2-thiouridine(34) synthase MnmA [Lachnospiraceae bacterium]
MSEKVVVGLSGGVDSSVAAYLLKEQGYEVIGVTMDTCREKPGEEGWKAGSQAAIADARRVAEHLGIPHYVVDFKEAFQCHVTDYFIEEYLRGRTPNPCVVCNRYVKWEALLAWAKEMGADYIATGHYARIDVLENGRYAIRNSITARKDQTYALYNLTQSQLEGTIMPVGDYTKEEIRSIAQQAGIPVAEKSDSQDICFIPDDDYVGFLTRRVPERMPGEGNFVDKEGNILGRHKGVTNYTIGQRKGLGIAMGHPVFVTELRPEKNEVVIGENEDVFTDTVICEKLNFMSIPDLTEPRRVLAKIRYNHSGEYCTIEKLEDGRVKCSFDVPVRASTPGQAVVFYDGEYVLGGGTIVK